MPFSSLLFSKRSRTSTSTAEGLQTLSDPRKFLEPSSSPHRFPPPIQTPRLFSRSYEEGGRLVMREVKVKHREFIRAHREHGRLTLKLVHVDEEEEEEERCDVGGFATLSSSMPEKVSGGSRCLGRTRSLFQIPHNKVHLVGT